MPFFRSTRNVTWANVVAQAIIVAICEIFHCRGSAAMDAIASKAQPTDGVRAYAALEGLQGKAHPARTVPVDDIARGFYVSSQGRSAGKTKGS